MGAQIYRAKLRLSEEFKKNYIQIPKNEVTEFLLSSWMLIVKKMTYSWKSAQDKYRKVLSKLHNLLCKFTLRDFPQCPILTSWSQSYIYVDPGTSTYTMWPKVCDHPFILLGAILNGFPRLNSWTMEHWKHVLWKYDEVSRSGSLMNESLFFSNVWRTQNA